MDELTIGVGETEGVAEGVEECVGVGVKVADGVGELVWVAVAANVMVGVTSFDPGVAEDVGNWVGVSVTLFNSNTGAGVGLTSRSSG